MKRERERGREGLGNGVIKTETNRSVEQVWDKQVALRSFQDRENDPERDSERQYIKQH